jgi:hypothetical protein
VPGAVGVGGKNVPAGTIEIKTDDGKTVTGH